MTRKNFSCPKNNVAVRNEYGRTGPVERPWKWFL
jgi:hypothetical protein